MADVVLTGLCVRDPGGRSLVEGVDLRLQPGTLLGLVGASGSGKSLTVRSLVGLVPPELSVEAHLEVPGADGPQSLYDLPLRARRRAFRRLRGTTLGLLPQDAGQALDPFRTVGQQLRRAGPGRHGVDRIRQALREAGFPDPDAVSARYPHELSGGMAQRVALAALLVVGAPFLVCDEPTTGLDATVQRALMATLRQLAGSGRSVVVISHALRWLHDGADRLVVFDGGRVVEDQAAGEPLTSEAGQRLVRAVHAATTPGFPAGLGVQP